EKNRIQTTREQVVENIRRNITDSAAKEMRYRKIREAFDEIIYTVLHRHAVLSSDVNVYGNIDFKTSFLDGTGLSTSEDDGFTYKKLLCVAFDIAVFSSYLPEPFVRFTFHDGALENLDVRKKHRLLEVMRAQSEKGLQQIITVIDSDLPT